MYLEEKQYIACGHTQVDSEREGRVLLLWQFELLLMAYVSGFPLANHLPSSQPIFSISQDPPICAHPSLS